MDKETLSHYGWIVILVLILSVMLALATPFGTFVADGFKATYTGLFDVKTSALDVGLQSVGLGPNITFDLELSTDSKVPTIVSNSKLTLTGSVTSNSGIKSFTINEQDVSVNNDGTWSTSMTLTKNEVVHIVAEATDNNNLSATKDGYTGYITLTNFTVSSTNRHKVGYTGEENEELVIPEIFYDEEDGLWYKVTRFDIAPFGNCNNLKSVVIPDTVVYMGYNGSGSAFVNCANLETVVVGSGVKEIGSYTFQNCTSLKNVTIKNTTTICSYAFAGCTSLEEIYLPDSIKNLNNSCFEKCTNLKNVRMPATLNTMTFGVFNYCSSLKSIVVPEGITTLGTNAFRNCTGLETVYLPSTLTSFGFASFGNCPKITNVHYNGTAEQWAQIDATDCTYGGNSTFLKATVHCK